MAGLPAQPVGAARTVTSRQPALAAAASARSRTPEPSMGKLRFGTLFRGTIASSVQCEGLSCVGVRIIISIFILMDFFCTGGNCGRVQSCTHVLNWKQIFRVNLPVWYRLRGQSCQFGTVWYRLRLKSCQFGTVWYSFVRKGITVPFTAHDCTKLETVLRRY